MYDDDPVLARLRALCARFPGTEVAELIGSSFRLLAHPRHVATLDATGLPAAP